MALSPRTALLLKYFSINHSFNETATLGRQRIDIKGLKNFFKKSQLSNSTQWMEEFLIENMNSSNVETYDNSDYEGASKIHDFGAETDEHKLYDTVIDIGSSEHIFNISQSFFNCIKLTKVGGMIIHEIPSNNSCGHGFYQVSPELYFSLYSEKNGFDETEVYAIDYTKDDLSYIIKLHKPDKGKRLHIHSLNEIGLLVKTVKKNDVSNISVFQSDYIEDWENKKESIDESPSKRNQLEKLWWFKVLLFINRYFKIYKIKHRFEYLIKVLGNDYKKRGDKIYIKTLLKDLDDSIYI